MIERIVKSPDIKSMSTLGLLELSQELHDEAGRLSSEITSMRHSSLEKCSNTLSITTDVDSWMDLVSIELSSK